MVSKAGSLAMENWRGGRVSGKLTENKLTNPVPHMTRSARRTTSDRSIEPVTSVSLSMCQFTLITCHKRMLALSSGQCSVHVTSI